MPEQAKILKQRLDRTQKGAVENALESLKENGRALVVMTTGTGKTRVGSKIIQALLDKKPHMQILWLTQMEELITQTQLDLQSIFGEANVGLFKRSKRSLSERIIVASLQTIEKKENLISIPRDLFDLIVVDEAHHAMASTWARVIKYFSANRLGLTATPSRHDGKDISDLFGSSVFNLSYEEAKSLKLIAEETYRVILTNSIVEGLVTRSGEYKPNALDRLIISEDRNHIIVESYKKYGRGFMRKHQLPMKAICFCITVSHAIRMRDLFRHNGIRAEVLVSKHSSYWATTDKGNPLTEKERREVYQAFMDGSGPEVLCVVNVLNEGKNVPDVSCLMMARPTRSHIILPQQIGRACRRIEGVKEKFIVLDFVDLMNPNYPPMTLSRVTGIPYTPENIVTEFYRGKDPVVVDEVIHYLSPAHAFEPEPKWTKEKISKALIHFFSEHGFVRGSDLVTHRTGLPNRTTIRRYWRSVEDCFEDLQIDGWAAKKPWTKVETEAALRHWFKKKGSIGVLDLGAKNKLPSRSVIEKYWNSWKACEKALRFSSKWNEQKVIEAFKAFKQKHGRYPKKNELTLTHGLPSTKIVQRTFGNLSSVISKAI